MRVATVAYVFRSNYDLVSYNTCPENNETPLAERWHSNL